MPEAKIRYIDMNQDQKREYHRKKRAECREKDRLKNPKPAREYKQGVYINMSPEEKKKYHHEHYLISKEKSTATDTLISILEGRGYSVTQLAIST